MQISPKTSATQNKSCKKGSFISPKLKAAQICFQPSKFDKPFYNNPVDDSKAILKSQGDNDSLNNSYNEEIKVDLEKPVIENTENINTLLNLKSLDQKQNSVSNINLQKPLEKHVTSKYFLQGSNTSRNGNIGRNLTDNNKIITNGSQSCRAKNIDIPRKFDFTRSAKLRIKPIKKEKDVSGDVKLNELIAKTKKYIKNMKKTDVNSSNLINQKKLKKNMSVEQKVNIKIKPTIDIPPRESWTENNNEKTPVLTPSENSSFSFAPTVINLSLKNNYLMEAKLATSLAAAEKYFKTYKKGTRSVQSRRNEPKPIVNEQQTNSSTPSKMLTPKMPHRKSLAPSGSEVKPIAI